MLFTAKRDINHQYELLSFLVSAGTINIIFWIFLINNRLKSSSQFLFYKRAMEILVFVFPLKPDMDEECYARFEWLVNKINRLSTVIDFLYANSNKQHVNMLQTNCSCQSWWRTKTLTIVQTQFLKNTMKVVPWYQSCLLCYCTNLVITQFFLECGNRSVATANVVSIFFT